MHSSHIPLLSNTATRRAASFAVASLLGLTTALPVFPRHAALAAVSLPSVPIRLPGSIPSLVAQGGAVSLGTTNPATALHLGFFLRGQDPAGLRQFVDAVSDPTSPLYRHYLTEPQYVARFGPSPTSVSVVRAYLQSQGLQVAQSYSGGQLMDVDTTVARAQQVFGVQFRDYRAPSGRVFYAATQNPQLPSAVAGALTAVLGLNNLAIPTPRFVRSGGMALARAVPTGGYGPAELRAGYDLNPLLQAGYDGTGQTVALMELDGYDPAAISRYDSHFGLTPPARQDISVDGASPFSQDGQGEVEVELDIEVVNAIAPGATVLVYVGTNTNDLDVYQKIASDDRAQVVSSSWGSCESQSTASAEAAYDTINQQMATHGQSLLFASGDVGSYCSTGFGVTGSLDASNDVGPHVTVVGGTSLTINGTGSGATYSHETTWNDNSGAGGGGLSRFWTETDASWQQGTGVNNDYDAAVTLSASATASGNAGHPRQVPDVSANADAATGYYTYVGDGQGNIVQQTFGGTSAAAPLWAGIIALSNQYAHAHGVSNAGFLNPTLYDLARSYPAAPAYTPFHDITVGTNDPGGVAVPGCTIPHGHPVCYPATRGYDLATGLGSPIGYNLVRDLAGGTGGTSATVQVQRGWNLISLPLNPSSIIAASDVLKEVLHSSHGSLAALYRLTGARWSNPVIDHDKQISGTDFTLAGGVGYLLYTDAAGSFTETSTAAGAATTWSLIAGWNLVGETQTTSVSDAIAATKAVARQTGASLVAIYKLSGSGWSSPVIYHSGQTSGTNFPLSVGQGYLVYSSAATSSPIAAAGSMPAMPGAP